MLSKEEVAEERSVEHLDMWVEAPSGHARVTHVCKTVPMRVWELRTSEHSLRAAGKHLVVLANGDTHRLDRLKPGDLVTTALGLSPVVSITDTGFDEELYDLRVESDDHIYFTDGIASHNSTGIGGSDLIMLNTLRNHRSLYLAPLKEHCKTYADTLARMQRGSVVPPSMIKAAGLKDNMYFKNGMGGGELKIMNILTDPTKVRGNSFQHVRIDEAQDFDPAFMEEIKQVQKAYPTSSTLLFAGTAKTTDTLLHTEFSNSSQGVWHIPCVCKDKWHALNDVTLVDGMMQPEGLRCPNRRNIPLRPELGEFVHAYPNRIDMLTLGFHLPQLIVPAYTEGYAYMAIYKDFREYPRAKFLKEVMGIAVDAGASELTEEDLKNICAEDETLVNRQRAFLEGRRRYFKIVASSDWGGSDNDPVTKVKESFTMPAVWGIRQDGKAELLWAERMSGMRYDVIIAHIAQHFKKFKSDIVATDEGGGSYYNAILRDQSGLDPKQLVTFAYTGTKKFLARLPKVDDAIYVYSLNKTDSLSLLFADVKDAQIIMPCWEESKTFLKDLLAARRNIVTSDSGKKYFRYIRHGAMSDDFMDSMNYMNVVRRVLTDRSFIPNPEDRDDLYTRLFNRGGSPKIIKTSSSGQRRRPIGG